MHFKRSFNKNHLEHDYKLLCLRLLFEKHGLIQSWKPEHEIRSLMAQKNNGKVNFKALVPDALITLKCEYQTIAVAVELELTLKNKLRLKELLKRYRQKKGIHAVFYIAGHTGIINSLMSIWRSLGTLNEGPRLWCLLEEELIKNPLGAKIQSSEGELSLAAFAAHSPAHRVSRDMNLEKERIERISSQNVTTMPSPMS